MGRPSKAEKYSPQKFINDSKELVGEALAQMKKQIKGGQASFAELSQFVTKMLPIVTDTNTQTETEMSMELQMKKVVNVNLRIQEANEQSVKEEDDTDTKP